MNAIRLLACLGAFAVLSACSSIETALGLSAAQQAQLAQSVTVGCQIDKAVQPAAAAVMVTLVPAAADAVSIDQALVHPAVLAACAALGATPVSVTTASVVPATASP